MIAPAILLGGLHAAGCSDGPGEGTIILHLTDAPFPFDMVASTEVTIDSVAVRVGGSADEESGFHTVSRTQHVVDLLELRNGVTFAVAADKVPAGSLDQVRVYTGEATLTLTDDRTFPLTFPSGSSSGVKVFVQPPIEIGDGETVEALIDYDLSQSFSATPSSPTQVDDITAFSFHPVLRVTNLTDVGGVSGTVSHDGGTPADPLDDAPLAGAAILVTQGAAEITSSASGSDGRYLVLGLPPGDYTVTASQAGHVAASAAVTVAAAQETAGVDLLLNAVP
jgi:hypothetical protein